MLETDRTVAFDRASIRLDGVSEEDRVLAEQVFVYRKLLLVWADLAGDYSAADTVLLSVRMSRTQSMHKPEPTLLADAHT